MGDMITLDDEVTYTVTLTVTGAQVMAIADALQSDLKVTEELWQVFYQAVEKVAGEW